MLIYKKYCNFRMKKLDLNENFISRIWENPLYYDGLKTTDKKKIEVIDYGVRNKDSGADFKNATVKIGESILKGDIEIHRSVKDWEKHSHHTDESYKNVVLNVALWEDGIHALPDVPTVILSEHLTRSIHKIWREIINNPSPQFKLPCYPDNKMIEEADKFAFIERLGNQRLLYRVDRIREKLESRSGDSNKWEKLLFAFTCEALGFSKNKSQFLSLAQRVDFEKASTFKDEDEFEAYLFGLGGFLESGEIADVYYERLKSIWHYMNSDGKPDMMKRHQWIFFRLRPQNFPTRRIAFASIFLRKIIREKLFSELVKISLSGNNLKKSFKKLLGSIEMSPYWMNRYTFSKPSAVEINSNLGTERIKDIIINVLLPLLYLYFSSENNMPLAEKMLDEYAQTDRASMNEVTRAMQQQLSIQIKSTLQSQGAIHLHNMYCIKGRCNECEMGSYIFVKEKNNDYLKIILY